jgi:transketolase
MPFVNKTEIDSPFVSIIQQAQGRVITFEDHQVCAGFGSMLTHDLAQIEDLGVSLSVRSLGVQGGFGQSAYLADELYASNGMDVQGLKAAAQNLLK